MYKKFKQFIYRSLIPIIRIFKYISWRFYLLTSKEIKIVVGAGPTKYKGWFSTDIITLDLTKREDFEKYFKDKKIKNVLAEHVLEHLTNSDLDKMAKNLFEYTRKDVVIRIAVPDGFHEDENYINTVKPGGTGEGANDHKNLFTVKSLSEIFHKVGFISSPIEFWDESKIFHQGYINDTNGYILRSFINDKRNNSGKPVYTSLIVDFRKR